MDRFHIVVSNYKRLFSFVENFHKIKNLDPLRDKVYIFDCSPEEDWRTELESARQLAAFGLIWGKNVFFIRRRNWAGNFGSVLDYYHWLLDGHIPPANYNFFLQEHYLDTDRFLNADTIPDDYLPDLNNIEDVFLSDPHISCAYAARYGIRISVSLPFLIQEPPSGLEGREYAPFKDTTGAFLYNLPEGGIRHYFFTDGGNFITRTESYANYFRANPDQLVEGNGSFGFAVVWELRMGKILMDLGGKWADLYHHVSFRTLEDVDAIETKLNKKISAFWIENMNWIYYYGFDLFPQWAKRQLKSSFLSILE